MYHVVVFGSHGGMAVALNLQATTAENEKSLCHTYIHNRQELNYHSEFERNCATSVGLLIVFHTNWEVLSKLKKLELLSNVPQSTIVSFELSKFPTYIITQ